MALALNKPKLDNLAGDIWKSAERLRGKFKAYEYQGVILPIIVIRRLECVLLAWREAKSDEVLAKRSGLSEGDLAKLIKELELNPQQSPFSNKKPSGRSARSMRKTTPCWKKTSGPTLTVFPRTLTTSSSISTIGLPSPQW